MKKKLIIAVFGLVLGVVIGELVIRATGLAPEIALISLGRFRLSPNPDLGYEPVPFFEYEGDDLNYFEFRGKSNSLGFRDREHDIENPKGTYRILIIGDSITMGLLVDDHEAIFPAVLQRELDNAGDNVEVLNFGVSGYNTRQEVATLINKGLVYNPDLVIVQYGQNDRMEMNGGIIKKLCQLEDEHAGIERSLLNPIVARSALFRFLRFQVFSEGHDDKREERLVALEALKRDTVEESFELLRDTSLEHDFKVLVVVFPYFARPTSFRLEDHRKIARTSAANGFLHLDLLEAYAKCGQIHGQSVAIDPLHPSAIGHECAGNAIAEYIFKLQLVK